MICGCIVTIDAIGCQVEVAEIVTERGGLCVGREGQPAGSVVLDVAFDEDQCQVGNAAQNLAILRQIALNLLKQEKTSKVGIHNQRLMAGRGNDYLLKVLAA